MPKNLPMPEAKQGKYFNVDFRLIRPIDAVKGGNVRHDYKNIPQLGMSFLNTGTIGDKRFIDLVKDIEELYETNRTAWDAEVKKRFSGQHLTDAIDTALTGYSKVGEDDVKLFYTLAGHRRTKAAEYLFKEYGIITMMPFIPKDIRGKSTLDLLTFMFDENENREGLNVFELGDLAQRMIDEGAKVPDVCVRLGKKRGYNYVNNILRMNKLPQTVKDMVLSEKISASSVSKLMNEIKDHDQLVAKIEELYSHVEQTVKAKGGSQPAKVKNAHVKKNVGTINSQSEIDRFFRKHKDKKPTFKNEDDEIVFATLQQYHKNQITVIDLDKRFFPEVPATN